MLLDIGVLGSRISYIFFLRRSISFRRVSSRWCELWSNFHQEVFEPVGGSHLSVGGALSSPIGWLRFQTVRVTVFILCLQSGDFEPVG